MDYQEQFQLSASPAECYEAWVSPETTIEPVFKIQVEPKVGGKFILHAGGGSDTFLMTGKFLELVPGKKVVYSWQWQGDPEVTRVEVRFETSSKGCSLTLHHLGFQTRESLLRHQEGWQSYIAQLQHRL